MSLTCVEDPNARAGRQPPALTPHSQKGKDKEKRSPPHSAFKKAHAEAPPSTSYRKTAMRTAHTHSRNKRSEAHPSSPQSFTYLFPEGIALRLTAGRGGWRPTLTVRHGAQHPLPSERTHQGAQSPSHNRNGGTQTIVVADHRCF
ncbi:hypothetical protein TcCL_NonESM02054 [Trypanosoma cruzi]|nr:hypothetical protein TcCL_NonESM02054 [Trypanosoma cruzi]